MPQLKKIFKDQEETKEKADGPKDPEIQEKYTKDEQEMIIFYGAPGSGKSTFWKNNLSSYERVNNDTLKTPAKCISVAEKTLSEKKSVVIDNTNVTLEQRNRYLPLAKKYNVPVRCFIFDVPKEVCIHNNNQRKINTYR